MRSLSLRRRRPGVLGPSVALWGLLAVVLAGALALLLHLNLRRLPPIDGLWRVEVAEHVPPLLAGDFPAGSEFMITRRGEVALKPTRPGVAPVVWAVIAREPCWGDCFAIAWLSLDYRVAPPSRMRLTLPHGPNRLEMHGADGKRVVALRAPAG